MKRRPNKPNPKSADGSGHLPAALQVLQPGSPRRQWLFRLLAGVVIPLLALLILEAALRLGGYGYDTSFFKPLRIGGREMLVEAIRTVHAGKRWVSPAIERQFTDRSLRQQLTAREMEVLKLLEKLDELRKSKGIGPFHFNSRLADLEPFAKRMGARLNGKMFILE